MTDVLFEKYLGDIISGDGKNKKNIKARVTKLLGVISNIMNILREVSLGQYYFVIARLLRETMFLSVMLLNSETWLNMTQSDIEELESVDRTLLRRILEAPVSTPGPALHLELGCAPVRLIIQAKRILLLKYILSRSKEELISKVFWAQNDEPIKNDWWLQHCQK